MSSPTPRASHVLLLAEHESFVAVDRAALRRLGVGRIRLLTRGREALRALRDAPAGEAPVNMVVCHERLADMTGVAFLQALRQDPALAALPLVLLIGHREGEVARTAGAFGGCALLTRPYTQDDAESALAEARSRAGLVRSRPERPAVASDPPAPAASVPVRPAAVSLAGPPARPASGVEGIFRFGLAAMWDGDAAGAREAFLRAYELDPLHVEACLALSKNSKLMEREEESRTWLCRAGVACLRRQETARAHDLFSRLPRVKGGANPLVPEAARLLREAEPRAAAFALLEAQALEPEQPLHEVINKAVLITDAPEEAMQSLCGALAETGYAGVARELLHRFSFSGSFRNARETSGFLDRFPVLRDIVSIASFTYSAWKQAA